MCIRSLVNERLTLRASPRARGGLLRWMRPSHPTIKWTRHYVWAKGCVCVWSAPLPRLCLPLLASSLSRVSPEHVSCWVIPHQVSPDNSVHFSASCYLLFPFSGSGSALVSLKLLNCLRNSFCCSLALSLQPPPLLHLSCVFRCGVKNSCQITNSAGLTELSTSFDGSWPRFSNRLACPG